MKTCLIIFMMAGFILVNGQACLSQDISQRESAMANRPNPVMIPNPIPVWKNLQTLSPEEKANSFIRLSLEVNASEAALRIARTIENLWNNGQFDQALGLFDVLARQTDFHEIVIHNSWRIPVASRQTALWGGDVRIGDRDSITSAAFDIHRASGHLFAVFLRTVSSGCQYFVNISTDNGSSWSETSASFLGYQINSLSASVLYNDCYIVWTRGTDQTEANMYCYRVDNGDMDTFSNGQNRVTIFTTVAPEYIKEVVLASNQDSTNNRLYASGITSTGHLLAFWANQDPVSWNDISPSITTAYNGLDIANNPYRDSLYLIVSFHDDDDSVHVYGRSSTTWHSLFKEVTGFFLSYTAISAYGDTIMCIYDYVHPNHEYVSRYQISRNGGLSWNYGYIDSVTTSSGFADVTLRRGAGIGVAYDYSYPGRTRFAHRGYQAGGWAHIEVGDHAPYWNKTCIEYLGAGVYGIVYLSQNLPVVGGAFFDKGVSVCSYTPGDINNNGSVNGIDIVFGVNYLKGGPHPPADCGNICPEPVPFYAAGDVNGNCAFNGIDITFFVRYLKGEVPNILSCPNCQPLGSEPPITVPASNTSEIVRRQL